jgi:hypothetical protein
VQGHRALHGHDEPSSECECHLRGQQWGRGWWR